MRIVAVTATAIILSLAGCQPADPAEQQADAIEDAADNRADAIEAAAKVESDRMEAQAGALRNQAGTAGGFAAERLTTRADALEREADIVEDQAETRARAIKSTAAGQAGAIRADGQTRSK